jgi:hypothetical protein
MNTTKPVILFRDVHRDGEIDIARKYFDVTTSRVIDVSNRMVIGRYSVLPMFDEVEFDLKSQGAYLVNNQEQHNYIAHFKYYEDIKNFTAETWFDLKDVPKDSGPWVVKGRTNSRKNLWKTHMFAADWESLVKIYSDLAVDPIIGEQGIIIRKFLELELVEEGISQPFFNEWRFFFFKENLLSRGFYWTCSEKIGSLDLNGIELARNISHIVKDKISFFVIDIARTISGEWKVIELNDGQQSGLSYNNPEEFYSNLSKIF